jgi:hypothetical protein
MTDPVDPVSADLVVSATGRHSLHDALAWLAEDHPLPLSTNWSDLLRALVRVIGDGRLDSRALRRVVREVSASNVDTSKVIFDATNVPHAEDFGRALQQLLSRSTDGTFGGLTPRGILRAQYAEVLAIETLCLAAGVAYADACEWFRRGGADWKVDQVEALLTYLTQLVDGQVESPIADSVPARAIEFLEGNGEGWALADRLQTSGVPYEILLAQRAVGGVWLAHKNKTSSFANMAAAELLCAELAHRGVEFRRSTIVGGSSKQKDLQDLAKIPDKRVGVVTLSGERVTFAVAFSAARDGGTARANGDGLLQIPETDLPFAVVLTGQGWAQRQETDRLARRFAGRLFTERSIKDLVGCIEQAAI